MYINKFWKFLIILFFNILFSSVVLSDESKSFFIKINTADEFVLSCNDYIDNDFRDSKKYTKISNIIKLLKKIYDLPANVLNDHKVLFENKEPVAITLFFNENNEDITDEVIEASESKKNNVFCFNGDSNNIPGDYAIIKLSPVTFFSLTCTEPNLRISQKEMVSELQKILPDFNENDLISDIYNYSGGLSNQNGELFCNKLKPETKFFYKKLANSSELILKQDSTKIKDDFSEIKINCDVLPDDILETSVTDGSREDCTEELNKRNNFKNEINFNLKKLEKLENIYKDNNITEILSTGSINKIIDDLEDLTKDLAILNLDEINIQYQQIYSSVEKYKTIFSLYNKYSLICIKESNSESNLKYTTYQDYQNKCEEIAKLDNFKNNQDRINIWNDKGKIQEFESSILKIQSEISKQKQIIENKKAEEIKIEDQKNSINNNINILNTKIKKLKKYIENENSKLIEKNKNFNKKNVFKPSNNLITFFEEDKSDITDLITQTNKKISIFKIEDDKKIFEDKLNLIEGDLQEIENKISNYKKEFQIYLQNDEKREAWKEEEKKRIAEEKKRDQEEANRIAEEKKRLKEAAIVAQEEEKIKETIANIIKLDKKINSSLKSLESYIEDETSDLDEYINNFKATNDDVIDFNAINSNIQKNEKLINKYLQEYGDAISSLPSDFDHQKFDFYSIDDLTENKIIFKRELKDLQEVISDKLDLKINEAKTLIDSREDQLVQIVSETSEELLLKEQELENTEAEKQKLEEEKRIAEEKNKQKEQLIDEKTGEIRSKDQTILKLQDDIKTLESNLVIEQENVSNRNLMIYLLISLSIILAGLLIYFIIRKKPTSNNADEGYVSKINELELRLEREIQQSRAQANNQTTTPIKTEAPKEIKKEPTKEEIKNEQLRKLYEDYNAAMKNPNLIETFQSNYNAIGLERESKISTGRKVRLRRVNTSFDRAIFWVVEHDRKLLVFGGRMLKVQAPSLLADDGTMARDLLQGIFALQTGPDLKTHKCAIVHKNNQIYEVMTEGTLQLPKID